MKAKWLLAAALTSSFDLRILMPKEHKNHADCKYAQLLCGESIDFCCLKWMADLLPYGLSLKFLYTNWRMTQTTVIIKSKHELWNIQAMDGIHL